MRKTEKKKKLLRDRMISKFTIWKKTILELDTK